MHSLVAIRRTSDGTSELWGVHSWQPTRLKGIRFFVSHAALLQLVAICFLTTPQLFSQSSTQLPGKVKTTYQSHGVTFAYPETWRVLDEKDGDVLIGSTAYEIESVTPNGVAVPISTVALEFGFYDANARDLKGAAYELLPRLQRRYPYLTYVLEPRRAR